jgi:hypothetical protein
MNKQELLTLAVAGFYNPSEEVYVQPGDSNRNGRHLYTAYDLQHAFFDVLEESGHDFSADPFDSVRLIDNLAQEACQLVPEYDWIMRKRVKLARKMHDSPLSIIG